MNESEPKPAPEGDFASCGPGLRRVLAEQPSEAVLALRRAWLRKKARVRAYLEQLERESEE